MPSWQNSWRADDNAIQHRNDLTEQSSLDVRASGVVICAPWDHSGVEDLKRFTETTKWSDPWYRRLSERAKLLWGYLTDNCNSIGLIDLDFESTSFHIGGKVEEKHLAELGDRVQRLQNGKIFIPKFIPFQYGTLSEGCPAHKPILKLVSTHQLTLNCLGYQYPINTLEVGIPIPTGKGMEKENEKDQEGVQGEIPRIKNSTVLPVALASSEPFRAAWTKWLEHLKQKRKPATLHAQDLQLRECSIWGVERSIQAIEHSIKGGFQGLYESRQNNGKPRPESNQLSEQIEIKTL